jgi:Ca2+-binding RTX toxin-like protein
MRLNTPLRRLGSILRVGRFIMVAVAGGVLLWTTLSERDPVSCSYSGAPRNVLTVTVTDTNDGELRRAGGQILVAELHGAEPQVFCSGGTPTIRNTDTIRVKLGQFASLELWLGNGAFEPGATPERDGASEIEIVGSGRDSDLSVVGTPAEETWQWGAGRGQPGLNLNARQSGDRDVDVTMTGTYASVSATASLGDDKVLAGPAAETGPDAVADVGGGGGDDFLQAPARTRGEISGGPGNDTIDGGQRPDEILGGAGDDLIDVRDDARDTVDCGPGTDRVRADRHDVLRRCEVIRRR